jgi:hypothetical protein
MFRFLINTIVGGFVPIVIFLAVSSVRVRPVPPRIRDVTLLTKRLGKGMAEGVRQAALELGK